jgi:hypothetical protein
MKIWNYGNFFTAFGITLLFICALGFVLYLMANNMKKSRDKFISEIKLDIIALKPNKAQKDLMLWFASLSKSIDGIQVLKRITPILRLTCVGPGITEIFNKIEKYEI